MTEINLPNIDILKEPKPKPRNTAYTARASKICSIGGHDWGRVPASGPADPRRIQGIEMRPGDICKVCGKTKKPRLDWDEAGITNIPVMGQKREFMDRSKYDARGRKRK